jgi:alkanesulfonate monooxygenase SsuD/methylene tetrahydromethanopterin reductase-like flavin-dependent oxidoreductase (luciferase family)
VSRNVLVASSDEEAEERVFGPDGSNRYFFTYIRDVLTRVGILFILKPQPDMPDDAATPEAILKECVIYGSPRTVLDKLVAFRERVGPFGTLLMTGMDWGGQNGAWEREGMRLLAQDVMPKFRQHVTAVAAE